MSQIKAFALTSDRDTFVQGATAFRNARGLAQRHRDSFIQTANGRARQSDVEAPPEAEITVAVGDEGSTDEFVDCEDYPSQPVGTEDYAAPVLVDDVDEEPALPQYMYAEDKGQESTSLGAEPAMSFATSFTSSFSQSKISSKRVYQANRPGARPNQVKPKPWLDWLGLFGALNQTDPALGQIKSNRGPGLIGLTY